MSAETKPMTALDVMAALSSGWGERLPLLATTPHGSYTFHVTDVQETPDGMVLALREVVSS